MDARSARLRIPSGVELRSTKTSSLRENICSHSPRLTEAELDCGADRMVDFSPQWGWLAIPNSLRREWISTVCTTGVYSLRKGPTSAVWLCVLLTQMPP